MNKYRVNIERYITLTVIFICFTIILCNKSHSNSKKSISKSTLSVRQLKIVDANGIVRMMLSVDKNGNAAIIIASQKGIDKKPLLHGMILSTSYDGSSCLILNSKYGKISAITPNIKSNFFGQQPHIIVRSQNINEDLISK